MSDTQITTAKVFKHRIPFASYIFKNGKLASFVGGKYITAVESEIKELEEEVLVNLNPHIYIDELEATVEKELIDPIEEIKRKAIEEYKALMAKSVDKSNDMGETDNKNQVLGGIANSSTIAEGAASSDSGASSAATEPATPNQGSGASSLSETASASLASLINKQQ